MKEIKKTKVIFHDPILKVSAELDYKQYSPTGRYRIYDDGEILVEIKRSPLIYAKGYDGIRRFRFFSEKFWVSDYMFKFDEHIYLEVDCNNVS